MTANLKVLILAVAAALLFTVGAAAKNIHFKGISCVDKAQAVTCSLPANAYPRAEHWTVTRSTLTVTSPPISTVVGSNPVVVHLPFDAEGVYQHTPLLHSPGAYAGVLCKAGMTSPTTFPGMSVQPGIAFVLCTPDDVNATRVRVMLFATPDGKIPPQTNPACPPGTHSVECGTADG